MKNPPAYVKIPAADLGPPIVPDRCFAVVRTALQTLFMLAGHKAPFPC